MWIPATCSLSGTSSSRVTVGGLRGSAKLVQTKGSESSRYWTRHTMEAMSGEERARSGRRAWSEPERSRRGTVRGRKLSATVKLARLQDQTSAITFQNKRKCEGGFFYLERPGETALVSKAVSGTGRTLLRWCVVKSDTQHDIIAKVEGKHAYIHANRQQHRGGEIKSEIRKMWNFSSKHVA